MARFSSIWTGADLQSQHQLAPHKARVHFLKGFRDDSFMRARISRDNATAVPAAPPPPPKMEGNRLGGAGWWCYQGQSFDPDSSAHMFKKLLGTSLECSFENETLLCALQSVF